MSPSVAGSARKLWRSTKPAADVGETAQKIRRPATGNCRDVSGCECPAAAFSSARPGAGTAWPAWASI